MTLFYSVFAFFALLMTDLPEIIEEKSRRDFVAFGVLMFVFTGFLVYYTIFVS